MHVLWITENYYPQTGGMAESCDRIVHSLRAAGTAIDLAVISRRDTEMRERRRLHGQDVFVPQGDSIAHALNRLWHRTSLSHEKLPYSHIVAFGGSSPLIAAPVFCKWLGIPLVVCLRGNDFDTAIFSSQKRRMLNDALQAATAIAVLSSESKRRVSTLFPHTTVRCIPNGIDLERWSPLPSDFRSAAEMRSALPAGKKVLGLFGHMKAKKGISFFLDAFDTPALRSAYHLLVVGTVDPEVEARLKDRFAGGSTLMPFRDRFALLPYYLACDYVALPSLYDGLPNVLLEAGALGIPCLGASVGGIADLLGDEPDSLFTPDSVPECRELLSLAGERDEAARCARGARLRDKVRREHPHTAERDAFLDLLRHLSEPKLSLQEAFLCTSPPSP